MIDKSCKNKFLNNLSKLPIIKSWVIDVKHPPKELISLNKILNKTSLGSKININDILLIQYLLTISAFLVGILLYILNSRGIINIGITSIIVVINIFIFSSYYFKVFIRSQAKKIEAKSINSLPIINNYIVNMMNQGRLVSEILYQLININTPYKKDFIKANEIFNKNPNEAFDYLILIFNDNYIRETFKILKKTIYYDENTLLNSLDKINNLLIRQYKNTLKKDADKMLINAELSMIIPFIFLCISVAVPIAEAVFNQIRNLSAIY